MTSINHAIYSFTKIIIRNIHEQTVDVMYSMTNDPLLNHHLRRAAVFNIVHFTKKKRIPKICSYNYSVHIIIVK